MSDLTEQQQEVVDLVLSGDNVCMTGPGGSGKTYTINHVVELMTKENKTIAKTALTGIAGTHIGGMTLHSWSGISPKMMSKDKVLKGLMKHEEIIDRWNQTDLVIIDEISMMSAEMLNKLDYVGRYLRENVDKPFGGLQLLLSGDFAQLPPIGHNERYCFQSENWNLAIKKTIRLTRVIRQENQELQQVLNEVRLGHVTLSSKKLLNSRLIKNLLKTKTQMELDQELVDGSATMVYPHKVRVSEINKEKLDEIMSTNPENFSYQFRDEFQMKPYFASQLQNKGYRKDKKELTGHLDKHCPAELNLHLAVGCRVMLTTNLNIGQGLVNGSTGEIVGFVEAGVDKNAIGSDFNPIVPLVRFYNGQTIAIGEYTWKPDHPKYILKRTQIPLILSWAITVHRAQGATLPCVVADLKQAFGPGMAYVILSRIKSLSGLYLEGISYSKIKCDRRVLEFYQRKG